MQEDEKPTPQSETEREKAKKALIGFLTTLLTGLALKIITMILAREEITQAVEYLSANYSFWISLLGSSGLAGYFAQKWTGRNKQ